MRSQFINNNTLDEMRRLLENGDPQQAMEVARAAIEDDEMRSNADFWFIYGKILWRLEMRMQAVAAYKTALAINPDSPAKVALQLSDDISEFFNPDLLNP